MSEHSHRSGRVSWRSRERKLRAEYRRKLVMAVIVALIIGLLGGIIVDKVYLTKKTDSPVIPEPVVTETPTEEPTVEPTEEPTEEPTALPTEVPTAEPTAEPAEIPAADGSDDIDVPFDPSEAEVQGEEVPFGEDEENPFAGYVDTTEVTGEDAPADEAAFEIPAETETAVESPVVEVVPIEEPTIEAEPTTEAPAVQIVTEDTDTETTVETEAETEIAEPEATPAPVEEAEPIVIPYGESCTMTTDINPDGSAHLVNDGTDFENLSLTLNVQNYLDYDYYDRNYGTMYNLHGGTAAVQLTLTLNDYEGKAAIIPQNFLLLTFCDKTGTETTQGVQLMDKEIKGNTNIQIISDVPATMFKRFYKEGLTTDMAYLVATTYNNGVPQEYRFEILIPAGMATPEPTAVPELYPELERGSTNVDAVAELQKALKKFGVLDGKADGQYGSGTADAVSAAQNQLGMEETGIASNEFQVRLFNIVNSAK